MGDVEFSRSAPRTRPSLRTIDAPHARVCVTSDTATAHTQVSPRRSLTALTKEGDLSLGAYKMLRVVHHWHAMRQNVPGRHESGRLRAPVMNKPKLIYFDAPVSRGEECRLALHIAGIDFEDVRIKRADWTNLKPNMPFGSVPVLELPGKPALAQSNAILTFIGREHGLHPTDSFEAARHEAVMAHVEDLRANVSPTIRIADEDEKRRAREALVATYLPTWAANAELQIVAGPFFAGNNINVVDIKLHMAVRWFIGGKVDYIPPTIFAAYPKLTRVHDAVRDDARVKAWYAKS